MAKRDLPVPKRKEIGDTGGIVLQGYIDSAEYNQELRGIRRIKVYNQMRLGDATVQAALKAVKLPIEQARWRVEPAGDRRQDKKIAELVEKELFDMPTRTWQEMLQNILLYLDYGVMPFEVVYEIREEHDYGFDYPAIGLRKLAPRFPDTIDKWQLPGGGAGIVQITDKGTFEIPMEKLVIFVNQKEGDNWEGVSILRSAYKHWFIKDKLYMIDAMATERQGLGIPYAEAPSGATPQDEDKIEEILKNMRANEKGYIMYPAGWKVGIQNMEGGGIKNPTQMIQHHDRQITKNVLAQFLELGGGGSSGSWALSRDQSELFILSIESVARYVTDVANRYLVRKLVDFNFDDVSEYPELTYDKIGKVDLNAYTTSLQRAMQVGAIVADSSVQRHVRDLFEFPESEGEVADPVMVEDMLLDEAEMFGDNEAPDTAGSGEMEEEDPTDEDVEEAMEALPTMTADEVYAEYGEDVAILHKTMLAETKPLSDAHKNKIRQALLEYWKSRKKTKSKSSGRKKKNPEVTKRKEATKELRRELRDFNDEIQREMLEMKAKGIKLNEEEMAKKRLEIFDRRKELKDKIQKLMDEIDAIQDGDKTDLEKEREEVTASDFVNKFSRMLNNVKKAVTNSD